MTRIGLVSLKVFGIFYATLQLNICAFGQTTLPEEKKSPAKGAASPKSVVQKPPSKAELLITVDSEGELFVDGVKAASLIENGVWKGNLSPGTHLILFSNGSVKHKEFVEIESGEQAVVDITIAEEVKRELVRKERFAQEEMVDNLLEESRLAETKADLQAAKEFLIRAKDYGFSDSNGDIDRLDEEIEFSQLKEVAEKLESEGNWERAIIAYEEVLLLKPGDPNILSKTEKVKNEYRRTEGELYRLNLKKADDKFAMGAYKSAYHHYLQAQEHSRSSNNSYLNQQIYMAKRLSDSRNGSPEKYIDPRDGQEYHTVRFKDGRVWFAESLRYEVPNTLKDQPLWPSGRVYYWKLYDKICPEGWSIPTYEDYMRIFSDSGIEGIRYYDKDNVLRTIKNSYTTKFKGLKPYMKRIGLYLNNGPQLVMKSDRIIVLKYYENHSGNSVWPDDDVFITEYEPKGNKKYYCRCVKYE